MSPSIRLCLVCEVGLPELASEQSLQQRGNPVAHRFLMSSVLGSYSSTFTCAFVHTLGKQPEGETTTICLKKSWTNSFSWRYWEAVEYNILTRAYCISQLVVDRYGCFNGRCRYWTGWPMVYIMQLLLFFITHQRCHPPLTSARSKFKFKVQNILLHGEWRAWGWGEPDWRGRLQICLHTFIRPSAGIGWCPSSQGGR